jgi:hypothetical protein
MYSGILPSGQKKVSHGLEGSGCFVGSSEGSADLEGSELIEGSGSLEGSELTEGSAGLEGAELIEGSAGLEGAELIEGSAGLGVGEQGTTMASSNKIHSRSTTLPPFLHSSNPSAVAVTL